MDPTLYPALEQFHCGGYTPYEAEVNTIIRGLYTNPQGATVVVAEDPQDGLLMGVCKVSPRPLYLAAPHPPIMDAAYVGVIGIQGSYRGSRLPDGVTRLGDVLLGAGLRVILVMWTTPQPVQQIPPNAMPPVWALIAPANAPSHDLFERHGFEHIGPAAGGAYDIRLRPRGRPL